MMQLELPLYQKEFYDAIALYFDDVINLDEFNLIVEGMK
tara:strand:+ start:4062 stop:4178 length:117 start_codon:yes stop_codon:yes gene_type:complete